MSAGSRHRGCPVGVIMPDITIRSEGRTFPGGRVCRYGNRGDTSVWGNGRSHWQCRCLSHPASATVLSANVHDRYALPAIGRIPGPTLWVGNHSVMEIPDDCEGCDPRMADPEICKGLIIHGPPKPHCAPISDPAMHRPPFPNVSRQRRSASPPGPVPKGSAWHGWPQGRICGGLAAESGQEPGRVGRCHEGSAMGDHFRLRMHWLKT